MSGFTLSEAIRAFKSVDRGGSGADLGPLVGIAATVAITGAGTIHMPDCTSSGKAKPRKYTFAELIVTNVQRGCKTCLIDDRLPLTEEQSTYALTVTGEWRTASAASGEVEQLRKQRADLKKRTWPWSRERLPAGSWPPPTTAATATGTCDELLREAMPVGFCEADAGVAYDAEGGTLTYHCQADSNHEPRLHEQAKALVAQGHHYRGARDFDLWFTWQSEQKAAREALDAIEMQYADVPPLRPVPICETCGEPVQIYRSRDDEMWFCPGEAGEERHFFRTEKHDGPSSVHHKIEHSVQRFLETLRRPKFSGAGPFAPSRMRWLGDESLNPDPELLDQHRARLLATIAVIDGAGLAADDDDLGTIKRQCEETLEAVEVLRTDGSAYRLLESAVFSDGTPSEIQQWLLIDTVTLGANRQPDVQFTLGSPDTEERLEIAELRDAIAAAREWADQQEAELNARENRQL